jgi:predicted transcriptional regulator
MGKKRERLDIIRDILLAVREGRGIKPTRLLYASNLSPQMFKDYVEELLTKTFIRHEIDKKGKKTIHLTKKGNDFLEEYRVIESFVLNFGL